MRFEDNNLEKTNLYRILNRKEQIRDIWLKEVSENYQTKNAYIKAPFITIDKKWSEHIWVLIDEIDYKRECIIGRLANIPKLITYYDMKDIVEIPFGHVEDYLIQD
ncbi:hypothetical protein SYNTR_1203 [Candidatus Syntrophocurvum alkaliphilum]|uniref:DUF2314 domain-containing protein n=1 Tax=Candidatus Syntrophocurvum alkaliphilum TaxID=2293317 RepID=A0A6I6DF39_9FIRM|nr:DUF2314 domain-containing protein [Candidatus Syntrophocurvum alkaliphilum]QGT99796.1 hypothetical protein SYNTR_1203 [Candidatus Syntrophocurvum alkaliphilum]